MSIGISGLLCLISAGAPCSAPGFHTLREADPTEGNVLRDFPRETQLSVLDQSIPHRMSARVSPWSDGPWSLGNGLVAFRYADSGFVSQGSVADRVSYVERHSAEAAASITDAGARQKALARLSPAEKYDLLVGNSPATGLARSLWREAEIQEGRGGIPDWMGLCDGWSAATIAVPEPVKPFEIASRDGRLKIPFNALDVKGLSSLAYSALYLPLPIAGGRCRSEHPEEDSRGRRVGDCFGPNPMTWHMAVLQMIGQDGTSLIIDRAPGVEVWNSPVLAYNYSYMNVNTHRTSDQLRDVILPIEQLRDDQYRDLRSPRARSVVGVRMQVDIGLNRGYQVNGHAAAAVGQKAYIYDLELDDQGRLVGGEWRSDDMPDFLWVLPKRESGRIFAAASGPLGAALEELVRLSR